MGAETRRWTDQSWTVTGGAPVRPMASQVTEVAMTLHGIEATEMTDMAVEIDMEAATDSEEEIGMAVGVGMAVVIVMVVEIGMVVVIGMEVVIGMVVGIGMEVVIGMEEEIGMGAGIVSVVATVMVVEEETGMEGEDMDRPGTDMTVTMAMVHRVTGTVTAIQEEEALVEDGAETKTGTTHSKLRSKYRIPVHFRNFDIFFVILIYCFVEQSTWTKVVKSWRVFSTLV